MRRQPRTCYKERGGTNVSYIQKGRRITCEDNFEKGRMDRSSDNIDVEHEVVLWNNDDVVQHKKEVAEYEG